MMRSPEQQYNYAKQLPMQELAKVLQGQSDAVEMYIADMVLRQKSKLEKAQQGAQAQQLAQGPKIVQKDLAEAKQIMQPAMDQGVAALPVGGIGEIGNYTGAGGGIVAFDDGGPVQHYQNQGLVRGSQLSLFPELAEKAAAAAPESRSASFANALRRMLGMRGLGVASGLYPLYELHSTGLDYDTGMGYGDIGEQMTIGTPLQAPRERPIDKIRAAAAAKAAPPTPTPAPKQENEIPPNLEDKLGLGSLDKRITDLQKTLGTKPTLEDAASEVEEMYKKAGVSMDPYAAYKKSLEEEKTKSAADRREAGWMRALEAGLGIMGGTSPYALTNIGEGSKAAAKGAMEDIKEFRKLDRERNKALAEISVAENELKRGVTDKKIARYDQAIKTYNDREFEISKLGVTVDLKKMELAATKGDRRMEAALRSAQTAWKNLPDVQKADMDEDTFIRDRAAQYLQFLEKGSFGPTGTAAPRGKVINGVYVPAGR